MQTKSFTVLFFDGSIMFSLVIFFLIRYNINPQKGDFGRVPAGFLLMQVEPKSLWTAARLIYAHEPGDRADCKKPDLFVFPHTRMYREDLRNWVQLWEDIKGGTTYRRFEPKTNIEAVFN
jgi:hypothetical protein